MGGIARASFDAAVVGGGLLGCTVALFLARSGMRTALVERGGLCREASGTNAGTLTMHPQVIGRGHRLVMLERLIDFFAGHPGVGFDTLAGYAGRWAEANPLEDWRRGGSPHARGPLE